MKKITISASILVLALLILPSVTFAVWWNPFTWFKKAAPVVPKVQTQTKSDTSIKKNDSTDSNKVNSEVKITPAIGTQNKIENIYTKYCVNAVKFDYKNADYSDAFIKKLGDISLADLETDLMGDKYTNSQLPEALYYLGFKLMQGNNVDDSIRFYQCSASNYYDLQAMYRMASVYDGGTDSIKQALPKAVIKNKIVIDYKKAYYWIASLIYVAKSENSKFLDTNTQRGWNSIAMLDDLQNTGKLSSKEMKDIETEVIKFISKRYSNNN